MFNNLKKWALNEINKFRCRQGQVNKDIYDKLIELRDGENTDLELMRAISNRTIETEDRLELLENRFNKWKECHRENLMLLMEYLGVYLDYEDDKKVIKKDKKNKNK